MLGDGRNDGNVNLGVAGIPERVETTTPRSNITKRGEGDETKEANAKRANNDGGQEGLELFTRDGGADVLDEADELQETEDA